MVDRNVFVSSLVLLSKMSHSDSSSLDTVCGLERRVTDSDGVGHKVVFIVSLTNNFLTLVVRLGVYRVPSKRDPEAGS